MESADKIEKAPDSGQTSNPIEPVINVKEEDQNENAFFIRDTGPYDVNPQTLSDIERDIADLEEARKLIKRKLKLKKKPEESPPSSILTTDMVAAINDTIAKELEARLGKKAPEPSKKKKKRKQKLKFEEDSDGKDDQFVDASDESFIEDNKSIATSIFSKSPLERLQGKLHRINNSASHTIERFPNNRTVLEESRSDIKRVLNQLDDGIDINMAVQEEEEILDQIEVLKTQLSDINILLDQDRLESEKRRLAPKSSIPKFDGDPVKFLGWSRDIDNQLRFFTEDETKITNLKESLVGDHREETLELIANADSYDEVKRLLQSKFGELQVLLPSQRETIRSLFTARNEVEENKNITIILNFYRLLESHKSTKEFNSETIYHSTSKLQTHNQHELLHRQCKTTSQFVNKLEDIRKFNYEIMHLKPVITANGPPRIRNRPNVGLHNLSASVTTKCRVCDKVDHRESRCPLLANKSIDAIKSLLAQRKTCTLCLGRYDSSGSHNCRGDTYYNRKYKKNMKRSCGSCDGQLNHFICPCRRKARQTGGHGVRPLNISSGVTLPPSAHAPNQVPVRVPPPSQTVPANNGDSLPGIPTIGSNLMNIQTNVIYLNGVPLGNTIYPSQTINIYCPWSNTYIPVLMCYDTCSTTTIFCDSLIPFMTDYQKFSYNLDTAEERHPIDGGTGELIIQTMAGNRYIQGLVKQIKNNVLSPHRVDVPADWITGYGLPACVATPGGPFTIIIGQDLNDLKPIDLEDHNKLSLCKSRVDGKLLLHGAANNLSAVAKTNMIRCFRMGISGISQSDQNWLDKVAPEEFPGYLPCAQHKIMQDTCSTCHENTSKPLNQAFEEELILSGLAFNMNGTESPTHGAGIPDNGAKGSYVLDIPYNKYIQDLPTYREEIRTYMTRYTAKLRSIPEVATALDKVVEKNISSQKLKWRKDIICENPEFEAQRQSFQPLNHVIKADSKTTPVRQVMNSSYSKAGLPSINDAMFVGAHKNKSIVDTLMMIRGLQILGVSDISQFYNNIKISEKDQALHTVLWRRHGILCDCGCPLEELCCMTLQFGMRCAQCAANLAKLDASLKFIAPVSSRAHQFVQSSYTDDLFTGGPDLEQLQRETRIISDGLGLASFQTQDWIFSGSKNDSVNTLGMHWHVEEDCWSLKTKINLAPKKRGAPEPKFTIQNVGQLKTFFAENKISKRQALRAVHSLYDPLGLYIQIKMNLFAVYRRILSENPGAQWDDCISEASKDLLEKALEQLLEVRDHRVPRNGLPDNWKKGVHVGLFFDGSGEAANGRIFLKGDNTQYFAGAVRLAELGPQAAAKTECRGMLLVLRMAVLLDRTLKSLSIPILSYFMFGDSEIALSSVCSVTAQMKLYYAARYRAAQEIIKRLKVKIYKVSSENNDADIGSKLNVNINFALESGYWESRWFHLPQHLWPAKEYEFEPSHLHLPVYNPKFLVAVTKITPIIPHFVTALINKYRSWNKINLVLSYILAWKMDWQEATQESQMFLLTLCQPSAEQIKSVETKFQIVRKETEKGMILSAVTRPYFLSVSKSSPTAEDSLWLVDGTSPLGRRLLIDHHIHCASPSHEQVKITDAGYFVIGARKFFRNTQQKCLTCLRIRKQAIICQMGPTLQPVLGKSKAPPLAVSMIDVFGPIKASLTRNTTQKLWILTVSCVWSRFTAFETMNNLTANAVLQALRTISYRTGGSGPKIIFADHGSNILPVQNISNAVENTEDVAITKEQVDQLAMIMRKNGTELRVSSPSAPWRQSLVESMHKILKLTFKRAGVFKRRLPISDWNHVLAFAEYTLNSRPLNLQYLNGLEFSVVLTPNKLMYGSKIGLNQPMGQEDLTKSKLYTNLGSLDDDISYWRRIYMDTYLQGAKKFSKWLYKGGESLKHNDIVLVADHFNKDTGYPALGQVSGVRSDRTYEITYVKSAAKLSDNMAVVVPAKKGQLVRPAQQLIKLFSPQPGETEQFIDMPVPDHTIRADQRTKALKMVYDEDIIEMIKDY